MKVLEFAEKVHKIADEKWKSVTPEQKARIVANIMRRAKERAEAKKKEAAP